MSDPIRFFVSADILLQDPVQITGEAYHHLRNVLRAQPGQSVMLLDGKGNCCQITLSHLAKDHATGEVVSRWQEEELTLPITLIQALPKGDKFDLILQKGTELGIQCFQPVVTEHTVPQLTPARQVKREQRWRKITDEAARQSRRSSLPEVRSLVKLEDAIYDSGNILKLVLWEAGSQPLQRVLPEKRPEMVQLLVGPEGGFSPREIAKVVAAGFQAVHLGPRILRTETAGLAATPVLQYLYGDWQQAPANGKNTQHEEKP